MEHKHRGHALKPITPVKVSKDMSVPELIEAMGKAGVMGGGKLAKASKLLKEMVNDPDTTLFLGLAGAMVPGGMRQILIDMIRDGMVNVLVCTGATFTHDLVEALGYHHYIGKHTWDDQKLNEEGWDRMYDSLMPNNVYEGMEDFIDKNFEALAEIDNIKDVLWKIGELTPTDSILKACWDMKVPVFCPALSDSGIGLMFYGQLMKGKKMKCSAFEDMKQIMEIAWQTKKAGVLYIGGGVPKNYIQQAMQLCPEKASHGIQITMDRPEPGGSSGAELKEGISWGKMHEGAENVDLICDATIALPIIYAAIKDKKNL